MFSIGVPRKNMRKFWTQTFCGWLHPVMIAFLCPVFLLAARTVNVPVAQSNPGFYRGDADLTEQALVCHVQNISTGQQNIKIEWIPVGPTAPINGTNPQNTYQVKANPVLSSGESFHFSWSGKKESDSVNMPKSIRISVTESKGLVQGVCDIWIYRVAGSREMRFGYDVPINGGRPF